MPPDYDIYAVAAGRDRGTVARFLAAYVDGAEFAGRPGPDGRPERAEVCFAPPALMPRTLSDSWDAVESVHVESPAELVDVVLTRPDLAMQTLYLPAADHRPDVAGVMLARLVGGPFVFGLSTDAELEPRLAHSLSDPHYERLYQVQALPAGDVRAYAMVRELCTRVGCARGYFTVEQPPPTTLDELRGEWDQSAFGWYPARAADPTGTAPVPPGGQRFRNPVRLPSAIYRRRRAWELRDVPDPAAAPAWAWITAMSLRGEAHYVRVAREAVALARAVLDGERPLVNAARRLEELLRQLDELREPTGGRRLGPDTRAFSRIRWALDEPPLGPVCEQPAPDAPDARDPARAATLAQIEAWARAFGLEACGRVVARYARFPGR